MIAIKRFYFDNVSEFKLIKWQAFCANRGVILTYTSPYTFAQNGISKRLNRYILEHLINVCSEKNIPLILWLYLIKSIAHIKNRTYNSVIQKSPFEFLNKSIPNIDYIRILGSLAYILDRIYANKLDVKSKKGLLVSFESLNN